MISTRSIEATVENNALTVTCSGDLDLHIADRLQGAFEEAKESGLVTADFRSVTYMDTAIAAVLISTAKTLQHSEHRLRVVVTDGSHPQYVLRIMGLAALMDIEAVERPVE